MGRGWGGAGSHFREERSPQCFPSPLVFVTFPVKSFSFSQASLGTTALFSFMVTPVKAPSSRWGLPSTPNRSPHHHRTRCQQPSLL